MKKLFVTLFVALFSLTFITAQAASMKKSSVSAADNSALIGSWVNVNSKPGGIDKLIIKQDSRGVLSVSGFVKCIQKDCVLGNVTLNTFSKSPIDKNMIYGLAVWNMHHANWIIDTTMIIKKLNTNEIRATIFTSTNKENSDRFNNSRNFTLKRVK